MILCAQPQLIKQRIFILAEHSIMNFLTVTASRLHLAIIRSIFALRAEMTITMQSLVWRILQMTARFIMMP